MKMVIKNVCKKTKCLENIMKMFIKNVCKKTKFLGNKILSSTNYFNVFKTKFLSRMQLTDMVFGCVIDDAIKSSACLRERTKIMNCSCYKKKKITLCKNGNISTCIKVLNIK